MKSKKTVAMFIVAITMLAFCVPTSAVAISIESVRLNNTSCAVGETFTVTVSHFNGEWPITYAYEVYKEGQSSYYFRSTNWSSSYTFTFSPWETGRYQVRCIARDATGEWVEQTSGWVTVTPRNTIKSVSAKSNYAYYLQGQTIIITATPSGGDRVSYAYEVQKEGQSSYYMRTTQWGGNTYNFRINEAGRYRVRVWAQDATGKTVDAVTAWFRVGR